MTIMYGQNAAILPATGAAAGLTLYASLGLGIVTIGLILLTLATLFRRHGKIRP